MFYREAGQFKTTYAQDMAAFPILQDKIGMLIWAVIAFVFIRSSASQDWSMALQ